MMVAEVMVTVGMAAATAAVEAVEAGAAAVAADAASRRAESAQGASLNRWLQKRTSACTSNGDRALTSSPSARHVDTVERERTVRLVSALVFIIAASTCRTVGCEISQTRGGFAFRFRDILKASRVT